MDNKDTRDKRDASVNGPLDLARHEAAGQDVDTLKEPDGSDEYQEDTDDGQRGSHGLVSIFKVIPALGMLRTLPRS